MAANSLVERLAIGLAWESRGAKDADPRTHMVSGDGVDAVGSELVDLWASVDFLLLEGSIL